MPVIILVYGRLKPAKKYVSLEVPDDDILSVVFSPDGKYLVTGTENNHAIAWDLITGNEVRRFKPEITDIPMEKDFDYPTAKSVEFSPDGKKLLTGSNDHTAFIFDFITGNQIKKFKYGEMSCATCAISASFSPDGKKIVFGNLDSVFICDSETGKILLTMEGEREIVMKLPFSVKMGNTFAAFEYEIGYIWNAQTGKLITTIGEDTDDLNDIRFSPDNNYVLTGGEDRMAKLWKIPSGKQVMELERISQ